MPTAREKRAAKEQAHADEWTPYWAASDYGSDDANPEAVVELQRVVKRLTERVTQLEQKLERARTENARRLLPDGERDHSDTGEGDG